MQIDRLDRVRAIKDEHGFLPTTYTEVNEALSLLSFPAKRGGAAKHLSEIAIHQQKLKERYEEQAAEIALDLFCETEPLIDIDPQATVRAVTHSYATFYADAAQSFNDVVSLAAEVSNTPNPKLTLLDEFADHPGLVGVARYKALLDYAYYGRQNSMPFNPFKVFVEADNSQAEHTTKEATATILESVLVAEGRTLLPEVARDQLHRFFFWEDKLYEARLNMAAKGVAETALRRHGSRLQ